MSRPRAITREVADQIARVLLGPDGTVHTIESACHEVGVNPATVRGLLMRYEHEKCTTEDDEWCGALIAGAKAKHLLEIRRQGFVDASGGNRAGTSWAQWQLEVQAPNEHKRVSAHEVSGPNGGPMQTQDLSGKSSGELEAMQAELEALRRENKGE